MRLGSTMICTVGCERVPGGGRGISAAGLSSVRLPWGACGASSARCRWSRGRTDSRTDRGVSRRSISRSRHPLAAGSAPSETRAARIRSPPHLTPTPEITGQEEGSGTPGPAAEPPQGVEPPREGMAVPEAEPLRPAARTQSFEETIGTRWVVWLGGLALALGGLFLVRYSIEQGWFGPGARIVRGRAVRLALLAVGEWMRRREHAAGRRCARRFRRPHIPSVLTAAGTLTAFGTVYAAHALYDMIGPATAFVLLGIDRHRDDGGGGTARADAGGPRPGGLLRRAAAGVVAAIRGPGLSCSTSWSWPSAYGLARIRGWLWLALATAGGAALWWRAFILPAASDGEPWHAHIVVPGRAGRRSSFGLAANRRHGDEEKPTLTRAALGRARRLRGSWPRGFCDGDSARPGGRLARRSCSRSCWVRPCVVAPLPRARDCWRRPSPPRPCSAGRCAAELAGEGATRPARPPVANPPLPDAVWLVRRLRAPVGAARSPPPAGPPDAKPAPAALPRRRSMRRAAVLGPARACWSWPGGGSSEFDSLASRSAWWPSMVALAWLRRRR